MSFHAGQTFTYGEQPSATKWQYLWDNDYALADGSGISAGAILSTHLAEAFLRGRRQNNTTDSTITGYTVQMGWGNVQGNAGTATDAVTFDEAFASDPIVLISSIGARATASGAPTGPSSYTTRVDNVCSLYNTSTTGFTAAFSSATSSSFYYGYSWIAFGPI